MLGTYPPLFLDIFCIFSTVEERSLIVYILNTVCVVLQDRLQCARVVNSYLEESAVGCAVAAFAVTGVNCEEVGFEMDISLVHREDCQELAGYLEPSF
jgi:hypothetical protein